jgi:hypothetical protein
MGLESKRPLKRVADKKAPRFRKTRMDLISMELAEEFLKEFPQYADKEELKSKRAFGNLIKNFNSAIWGHTIENRDGIDLPERLGVLFVGAKTSVYTPVDYGETNKYGTEVLMHNYESNGLIGKIFYSRHSRNHGMTIRTIYSFKPCREYSLAVRDAFRNGDCRKYRRVENKKQLQILFEERMRNRNRQQGYGMLDNYNEFA